MLWFHRLLGSVYGLQEFLPSILMDNKVEGTLLSGYVIVANDVTAVQITDFTQPNSQFYKGLIRRVSKLAGFVRVADFYGDSILVSVVAGRGFFVQGNALDDLAFQANHKMGTDLRRTACVVVPVLLGGGAGVAHIVDHDVPDTFKHHTTAGIAVHIDDLLIDPVRDLRCCQLKNLFSRNELILVDVPTCCQKSQKQNESEESLHGLSNLLGAELPVHNWHQNYRKNGVNHEQ